MRTRLALSLRSYRAGERVHAHDFHQIVLPLAGVMEMRVGAAAGRVGRSEAVLVPGGQAHAFRVDGENRFVVLDMAQTPFLPDGILAHAATAPFFAVDEPLHHLAQYLAGTAAAGRLDAASSHHAMALLTGAITGRFGLERRRGDPVARARALVEARYAEPLTVAALAETAGMGMSRFHERFRRETGATPAEYLARIRLDRAAVLLRETVMPIAEIALAVGFSDQSAFTRSLKRRHGTTPAALRRRGREERP